MLHSYSDGHQQVSHDKHDHCYNIHTHIYNTYLSVLRMYPVDVTNTTN
jgi:hypothetical protein